MKSNQLQPKFYFFAAKSICTILFLSSVVISCQKENKSPALTTTFNADAAKEWYYGIFKKSSEWLNSSSSGKQLPNWKISTYRKIGGMEIVEFPLMKARTKITIPKNNSASEKEIQRIADASLIRIVFVKTASNIIFVREINYIPDWNYLQKKEFDISSAGLLKEGNDFSGRIVIKKWNEVEFSRLVVKNGIITHKGTLKGRQTNGKNSSEISKVNVSGCEPEEICEYARDCERICYGDYCTPWECTPWEPTGICLPVNNCPESACESLSAEECMCQTLGCGSDDNDNGTDECSGFQCPSDFMSTTMAEEISSVTGSEFINSSGLQVRRDQYNWYVNKSTLLGYVWKFKSFEETEATQIGGRWKFVSVKHISTGREGTLPPCVTSDLTMDNATPNILNDGNKARMDLTFRIRVTITCCKFCPDTVEPLSTSVEWACKQQ
jgi:hypothetical protein